MNNEYQQMASGETLFCRLRVSAKRSSGADKSSRLNAMALLPVAHRACEARGPLPSRLRDESTAPVNYSELEKARGRKPLGTVCRMSDREKDSLEIERRSEKWRGPGWDTYCFICLETDYVKFKWVHRDRR